MTWTVDARVPVRLGALGEAAPGDALLIEGGAAAVGFTAETFAATEHAPGCACCPARSGAAWALARLFQRRATGDVAFFRRILAVTDSAAGDQAVRAALCSDPVVAARFKLDVSGL